MKKSSLLKAIMYTWTVNPHWFYFNSLYIVIAGLIPILTIWLSKELINEITKLISSGSGPNNIDKITFFLILQFLTAIFSTFLSNLHEYIDKKTEVYLGYDLQKKIFIKTISLSYITFDDNKFLNSLSRIKGSAGSRFLNPIRHLIDFFKNIITLFSLFIYLYFVHWSLLILVIIPAIPVFITYFKYGKKTFLVTRSQAQLYRETNYTSRLLTERDAAKEIRLFGLGDFLINRWSEKSLQIISKNINLQKKQQLANVYLDAFKSAVFILNAYIIIRLIFTKGLGIGDFVAIGQAVQETQSKLSSASVNLANILEDILYIKEYYQFMEGDVYKNDIASTNPIRNFPNKLEQGILIKNLSFSYIGCENPVLNNISFQIRPGEKIAIVGENGSGKTTLVKCLLGLYPTEKESIIFDGIDINEIRKSDLHKNVTALFQDFVKYSYTLRDNIAFGNVKSINDISKINEVAFDTGIGYLIKDLKNGYDTFLTRALKEGVDLSGGQWQKIGLARALFREAQVIFLDEPTSSLDPNAEKEIFKHFNKLIKDKTAIFISHRMSATKIADRIIVMKAGKIVESGSFTELINLKGEFSRMYQLQAQLFNDKTDTELELLRN